jgi:Leucine-rich repeat (LRR) protein
VLPEATLLPLTALRSLWLHANQLTALPSSIGALRSLEELSVYGNRLTRLPPTVGALAARGSGEVACIAISVQRSTSRRVAESSVLYSSRELSTATTLLASLSRRELLTREAPRRFSRRAAAYSRSVRGASRVNSILRDSATLLE